MWHADGGHVTEGRLLAMMRDARRLVGVSHVNICPVAAVCFDSVSAEPAWFLYHSSSTSVFLKKFLDDARKQANVRRVELLWSPTAASYVSRRLLRVYFEVYFMVALCNRQTIFILSFVLLFFPRLISAVGDWMSAILPHMVWP